MATLQSILLDPARRTNVVTDCSQLVDDEVSAKGGLSGMAIKGVYLLVKKIKPGFIGEVVGHLMDEFVNELDPFYQSYLGAGRKDIQQYLQGRSAEVASGLLGVTDKRVQKTANSTIKAGYAKLRPSAAKHVEAAVPGIARILAKYT